MMHGVRVRSEVEWSSGRVLDSCSTGEDRIQHSPGPLQATSSELLTYCVRSGQLSLLLSAGWEMSSSLPSVGYGVKA